MRLSELKEKQKAKVEKIEGPLTFRKRISEMGFIKGKIVEVIKSAPLKDPFEYKIMGYEVSLRKSEAELIKIVALKNQNHSNGEIIESTVKEVFDTKENGSKTINVALIGNPNSGKTTFFNYASGSREHVGNYCGVTVAVKKGKYKKYDYTFNISDLPGTYSLSAITPDELFVVNHLLTDRPDVVINVVDSSNLERNLYLTMLLTEMDLKVVVALNMYDELKSRGEILDIKKLSRKIGVPIIPTVSTKGQSIDEVFDNVISLHKNKQQEIQQKSIDYGPTVERSIHGISEIIPLNYTQQTGISKRGLALRLIEKDTFINALLSKDERIEENQGVIIKHIEDIEKKYNLQSENVLTNIRYWFISTALKLTYRPGLSKRKHKSEKIDKVLTNKYLGFPIFFAFMYLIFYFTFKLGDYPMQWIENFTAWTSHIVSVNMADGPFKDLLVDGIISGTGGVLVFLPNIVILFFFISLMEDTGYMARAIFIMDKIMRKIGLHGKSFIPLMMGFGCNVPAIMSSRIIGNRSDRLITILVNPFMSCSARLPIYLLIIGTFFVSYAPLVLFSIYTFGVLLAVVFALIFRKYLFPKKETPFVLELPPYRIPTFKNTVRNMWHKASQYLKKIAGVILIASIIIWALNYFPRNISYSKNYDALIENINQIYENQLLFNPDNKQVLENAKNDKISEIRAEQYSEYQSNTYIARIGKAISPIMKPLGFDWKMSVSILTGLAAKEVVVSTMAVIYQDQSISDDENKTSLRKKIYAENILPHIAIAFLIFVLVYFPCVSVIIMVAKETHWGWAVFIAIYTTVLAWILAFIINQFYLLL